MTREEAIEELERLLWHWDLIDEGIYDLSEHDKDAVEFAISALRGPTREMVERMRGEWIHDPETGYEHCDKCSHTISLDDYMDRKPPLFCEMCGDAKTDEAVDMMLERLEAQQGDFA